MQPVITNDILQSREEAGFLLSKKLESFKNSTAIVVAIPRGGVCVASVIAETLSLPLEVIPCRTMKHPGDSRKTIGSVSLDEIFMHDFNAIPQDYICHQITMLRGSIAYERKKYYIDRKPLSLCYRPVILVDEILSSADAMIACLRSIRKQSPLRVVVAVPVVAAEAARVVSTEADDVTFLRMEPSIHTPSDYFADFPAVDERKVWELLAASRRD